MITYKGDRFVKGKTFLHESSVLRFVTKSKKGYIFESIETNEKVVLDESVAKSLKEVNRCQKVA